MAEWRIGTSGWSYANWRGPFYPRGLKQGDWIGYYAGHLDSVELNASFYRLPAESMLDRWRERTPDGFVFAIKAWRAITHYRRLADCADLLPRMLDRLERLGDKAGPILFQLPPHFACDLTRLRNFLELLPEGRRYAMEFRDPEWHQAPVYDALRERGIAFCPFELGAQHSPRMATADFVYVRLHGSHARYHGSYSAGELGDWADWLGGHIGEGRDAYVYFDNTDEADYAVRNALSLKALLDARCAAPARTDVAL